MMTTFQGFTLLDLLLALVLVSGTAIGLLTQQGQNSRLLHSDFYDSDALNHHANLGERHAVFQL